MGFFAPRIPARLREEIDSLAAQPVRPAEICRAIGEYAEEQGFRRPCYEQVRVLVRAARQRPRPARRAPGRRPAGPRRCAAPGPGAPAIRMRSFSTSPERRRVSRTSNSLLLGLGRADEQA